MVEAFIAIPTIIFFVFSIALAWTAIGLLIGYVLHKLINLYKKRGP